MLFYYFSVTFAQCPPEEAEETKDLQVLLCVLATLISGSETKLLADCLAERRV